MFPSPIGVIFSLIRGLMTAEELMDTLFPSPIGVIFSLIYISIMLSAMVSILVSVSYRSYILTYLTHEMIKKLGGNHKFPSPIGVIFSLMLKINIFY